MKNLCQRFQFQIGDIAFVRLNPGNHIFIHIVACQLELAGKITLGETMFGSQCNQAFTDQVFFASVCPWFGHGMSFPAKVSLKFVSFFAPFSIILYGKVLMSGCKSDTNHWIQPEPLSGNFRSTGWEKHPPPKSPSFPGKNLTIQILIKTHTKVFKKSTTKGRDTYYYRNRSWLLCHQDGTCLFSNRACGLRI